MIQEQMCKANPDIHPNPKKETKGKKIKDHLGISGIIDHNRHDKIEIDEVNKRRW